MFEEIRFFDFCRIELFGLSNVSPHSFEGLNPDESKPSRILYLNDTVRKITYAARHQNRQINNLSFDFFFSIFVDSQFNIISVDIDIKKMIDDYEKTESEKTNQGKLRSSESMLSVVSRYLLRAHLSLDVILNKLEEKLKDSSIPLSLTVEKDYIDESYIKGRIVSSIKMFFSVIDIIIDDDERLTNFLSSFNYENINDVITFIDRTQCSDFLEEISYEENDTKDILMSLLNKTNEIGALKIRERILLMSKKLFSERIINYSSERKLPNITTQL